MVNTINQAGRISDWLLYEEDDIGRYSRSNVAQAVSSTLLCGAVVAKNATGEIVEFTGVTGAENAAVGIAVNDLTTGAATSGNVIIERHARIAPSALVWKAGVTDQKKSAALASLAAAGILTVKES